ncbi:MAG: HEAT repeat domain-containing protein, partial [Deltaproteobacteria bacterium]|nr:HEAT repeat domain-containing protein [Deltaproteobacteria bacterium]
MMKPSAEQESILKMIADHMDGGFLENIVDMFKNDDSYYPFIGCLLGDERGMVRIGTVALVETLKDEYADNVLKAVPGIAELLRDARTVIRGDAAYLLGIIGHTDALPFL